MNWLLEKMQDLYYNILRRIEWIKRSYDYTRFGWEAWDFDALTIERYMLFKLKRVQECLINGSCDLTVESGPKKMKALKLTLKLLTRLNGHYHRFSDLHDLKWGNMVTWFEPAGFDKNYGDLMYWKSSRPNATTPELIKEETKEFLEAMDADAREECRDRRIMYLIVTKYISYWWD